jgi:hypothetical protein
MDRRLGTTFNCIWGLKTRSSILQGIKITLEKIEQSLSGPEYIYRAVTIFERVHIDILGTFTPCQAKNLYILMIVDQFST